MKFSDIIAAVAVLLIIVLIIVPLNAVLLDFLLVLNISVALMVLLMAIFTKEALEFSVFPPDAADSDPLPARAQHFLHSSDPRQRRRSGSGDQDIRRICHRREYRRRSDHLYHHCPDPVHCYHKGIGNGYPKSRRGSPWTPCPASKWRLTRI